MLLLIGAAHVGVLVLLVSLQIVPVPVAITTLTVDILTPAPPAPQPEIVPPKPPRPVEPKPKPRPRPTPQAAPQQIIAAETTAPAAEDVPAPVVQEAPPAPPAPPLPAPAATISEPRYDADYLSNPKPVYPSLSRRMGEEGRVLLRVFVEADGRPSQIEIKETSGSPRLDRAAQDAVQRWRFVAARRGDEALAAWVLVPIAFNLKN
ncbi:MAG: energy transducer TonB [Azospira sp.]|nr:energy transducer TonB [Azospira sp.]